MNNKTLTSILSLLLLFMAMGVQAQETSVFSGGSGTSDDPYLITTQDDWRQISQHLNACFKLMQDITIYSSPASDTEYAFSGTFDGNGHTITANIIEQDSPYAALFSYVAGGTIRNLHVQGTINGGNYTAGLVGIFAVPNSLIENCRVSATITGNNERTAGFVASTNSSNLTIRGCLFDGKLVGAGSGTTYGASFVAERIENGYNGVAGLTIEDCVEKGTYTGFTHAGLNYNTQGSASAVTTTRTYHSQNWGEGIRAYSISSGGGDIVIDFGEPSTYFNVSDIAVYSEGFRLNGLRYAKSGATVAFTATDANGSMSSVIVSSGTVSGSNGNFSLTLDSSDATITVYDFQGNGTAESPYLIQNSADWETLVAYVKAGQMSTSCHYLLTGDISVKNSIGTSNHPFIGNFNGGGHTIDCNLFNANGTAAPFAYISGATIANLHVTGEITGGLHTSGLVGYTLSGTNVITDCHVSAAIEARPQDDKIVVGGIVGHAKSATNTVIGCLFDGRIAATASLDFSYAGAIIGWSDHSDNNLVKNCIENATSDIGEAYSGWLKHVGMNYDDTQSASAVRTQNCYTLKRNWSEVKRAYKVESLTDGYVPDLGSVVAEYPTTGIVVRNIGVGSDDIGLSLNGTYYAGSGETVRIAPNLPTGFSSVFANNSAVYQTYPEYMHLTMPSADVYLSLGKEWTGAGTEESPYLIEDAGDWQQLAYEVNVGRNTNGEHFLLTKDIDIYIRVGNDEHPSFSGSFDGGGHTITAYLSGGESTAPFYKLDGGTIKNLHVAGEIEGGLHTAGLVGGILGNGNQNLIKNCRVSATIACSSTHVGGFVGHASSSTTTIEGCLMDGTIKGKAGNTPDYVGVFYGWCSDATNLILKNSVSTGTYEGSHIDLAWKYGSSATATCPVSNTYFGGIYNIALGKRFYTISTKSTALTLNYAEPGDTYSVSDITVYEAGLMFGNQRIAGQNEVLTFGVIPADGFSVQNVQASSGSLVSMPAADTEVYHLTMGAQDVVVSATVVSTSDFVGSGTEANPYLIQSSPEWVKLAIDVENGTTYSGKVFRLTNNIDTEGMTVGTEEHPFSGTFDGDNHTLTMNCGHEYTPVANTVAPFLWVSGATIRHLHTAGTLHTNGQYSAGIVARIKGSGSTSLYDCHSAMTIHTLKSGDASFGGLVGGVSEGADTLFIEKCSFSGKLTQHMNATNCGGFVGWSSVPVVITNGLFDPQGWTYFESIRSGATFARMKKYSDLRLTDCYTTYHFGEIKQGVFVIGDIDIAKGCTYEFLGEPEVTINGKDYYKNGCWIRLTASNGLAFDHWVDNNGCFISDPWTRDGVHQLKDLTYRPSIGIATTVIPEPETERTYWGVTYRYLSRRDYHYYISDEDRIAKGWTFESGDSDANMIVKNGSGKASEITAVTGYKESDYNSDGVQIHNDLVGDWRNHTHLGLIAPHAFRNSTKLETMYFKDTDANNYNTLLDFDFFIGEGAFEGCSNFKELKMMQYTTRGDNHWEGLKPTQTFYVADDAFTGCTNLKISAQVELYQGFLSSNTWKNHRSRFIIYEATTEDFTVEGVQYHWYRDVATEDNAVKNDEAGKADMMKRIVSWNADYQKFNAADLLVTKPDCNVYYAYIMGVKSSDIISNGGTMKIYNDPGAYYNYKCISLGRDAIAGNTDVKKIEFHQTNGRSENSYSDLKMVIPNGALKGCTNLEEFRLFYYVKDGDDHWESLGPEDVIPGDNIFGEPSVEEMKTMSDSEIKAMSWMPKNFRFIVSPDRYPEFLDDPNWYPYLDLVEPLDFEPNGKMQDFSKDGLTYSYMTSPGGILQTSQVVSQDVSWWTAPRIAIEVAIMVATLGSAIAANPSTAGVQYAEAELARLEKELPTKMAAINVAEEATEQYNLFVQYLGTAQRQLFKEGSNEMILDLLDYLPGLEALQDGVLSRMGPNYFNTLVEAGLIDSQNKIFTEAGVEAFKNLIVTGSANQYGPVLDALRAGLRGISSAVVARESVPKFAYEAYLKEIARFTALKAAKATAATRSYYFNILASTTAAAVLTNTPSLIASRCWGNDGYNAELLRKGMRENILSNIHQVGLVGGGYVITTPQKNLVYHTYIKEVDDATTEAVIYAGQKEDTNASNRTMTFGRKAFRNKTNLQKVSFHENTSNTSNASMPLLLTIPDSAFVGCTKLTEFNTLLKTKSNGTRALGPENFVLAGDSIFAGLKCKAEIDSLSAIGQANGLVPFYIVIDPLRKQDFLDNESWAPLQRFFKYESANPKEIGKEYGARYAYAYEQNSIKKENKMNGHLIEHTIVIGPDDSFIAGHQGAVKLCNDIGVYNNYQLDYVQPGAFRGNKNLRTVSFVDLYGLGAFGDVYTEFQVYLGDSAFVDCSNLANLDLLYMVTDGLNHITPMTPQMISIGKGVFDKTQARLKMLPQQVSWFENDSAWAPYKDRFLPCVIKVGDEGIKKALVDMAYYDPANVGTDQAYWKDYIDFARIAGAGFSWLDGKFTKQKDKIHSFADFSHFECVGLDYVGDSWFEDCSNLSNIVLPKTIKTIGYRAFRLCSSLKEIELPAGVTFIGESAFNGCTELNTIVVRSETPATLRANAFYRHEGLKIYVPADKVETYKSALTWEDYAPYIVSDADYKVNKVVTVTDVGQLASKLGLTLTKESDKVRYLNGPWAKYDSLTVIGPLNGEDLAVIRHMAGADAYDSDPTEGRLRYLNLWNANIKKDKSNCYNGNWMDEYIDNDNEVPDYLFENCHAIETVIFPKSATFIGENIFEEATAMKRVCVGRKTTKYDSDILQDIGGIEELMFLTESPATSSSSDPWEAPIMQVWALPSQVGAYMGDPRLTQQAMDISAPMQSDDVMWALAEKGHYFPTQYSKLESVEGIFEGNTTIKNLNDFSLFYKVKMLDSAFNGMTNLETITIPAAVDTIAVTAFANCKNLMTIHISKDSVPRLAYNAFKDLPSDFQILVPKRLCKLYRERWAQYADHINTDKSYYLNGEVLTITVTDPNTVAQKLGLTVTTTSVSAVWSGKYINSVKGDYSKVTRLKIIGPISGGDLDVLRYLAGWCPWANTRNYAGHLEYLDLYDATLVPSDIHVRGRKKSLHFMSLGEESDDWFKVGNNTLPHHAFLKAYNLRTLILPKTCTTVNERALQECEGLEALVIGDDCTNFNWNALDDDAMLTRMYLLTTQKVNITEQNALWVALCNNYMPTFDAFYVRPSVYNDYIYDQTYINNNYTSLISKGAFTNDDDYVAFASHAAATIDDISTVNSVNGWFDTHNNVRDLTLLGYSSVAQLRAADIQKLTKLEKVMLPVTLEVLEDSVFSQSPNLQYVDFLSCDSTCIVADLHSKGFSAFGIDSLQTLVYVPRGYGQTESVNIIVAGGTELRAKTYRVADGKDYAVPYAFVADKVQNSRKLNGKDKPYSVFLPYKLTLDLDKAKVYMPADREGTMVTFVQIPSGEMEAFKPYVVRPTGRQASLDVDEERTIPALTGILGSLSENQWELPGYTMRGTLSRIDNKEAAEKQLMMLVDGKWTVVPANKENAYVSPFRSYLMLSGNSNNAQELTMTFEDTETMGVDTIRLVDLDGSERYYDLNGRLLPGKPDKGVYIYKGKKHVSK
ncbi:MAG: leucine-rich repeat protein [Prevotella sp.]|nr:leucine-rich repeat protein [Prevotella sp.]